MKYLNCPKCSARCIVKCDAPTTIYCRYCDAPTPPVSRRCQIKALIKELRQHPWHQTPAQVADRLEQIIGGENG